MQRTTGLYAIVTFPRLYELLQNLLGANRLRQRLKQDQFPDLMNKLVLEVGCGPGIWIDQMKEAKSYLGVDLNANHIAAARKRNTYENLKFEQADVSGDLDWLNWTFDYVFAFGLIHHLDDDEARNLLAAIQKRIKPDGLIITVDPVYHENQSRLARWIINRDSGRNVRTVNDYTCLMGAHFEEVTGTIETDLLNVPYSHLVMRAKTA